MSGNDEYLGDGLYVNYDGYQFCLRTERDGKWEEVYLEPYTLDSFIKFVKRQLEKPTL